MTAWRSFDVAGNITFLLWRHGQRCNGTMPTLKVASLCLLSQRSAWIPRARSLSQIERSRTRLSVGVRSLMCEKIFCSTKYDPWYILYLEFLHILACFLNYSHILAWNWMYLRTYVVTLPLAQMCIWGNISFSSKRDIKGMLMSYHDKYQNLMLVCFN